MAKGKTALSGKIAHQVESAPVGAVGASPEVQREQWIARHPNIIVAA